MNDGGPAFPRPFSDEPSDTHAWAQEGMSLFDYFAGQALMGILAGHRVFDTYVDYADEAYNLAEAMLKERERRYIPPLRVLPKDES